MGSPVPGFLVFMLIGAIYAWQSWRQPHCAHAFEWTEKDTWLALCFVSIPLFKVFTLLWTTDPRLALGNVVWHLYFLFWPLVLVGLDRCRASPAVAEKAMAMGLIAFAAFASIQQLRGQPIIYGNHQNPGIAAQIAMVVGSWNLLALTRPGGEPTKAWRKLHALAFACTGLALFLTTRRLELLGFALISTVIIGYRLRHQLTWQRAILMVLAGTASIALLVYLRWDKFVLGFEQIARYRAQGAHTEDFTLNSWGIRLELWRVSLAAFLDHPWLGLSASARPFNMQAWGAPPAELFNHRHFHSHLMQVLVEGGLLGLAVLILTLRYSTKILILQPWKTQPEIALLSAALLAAYAIEGTASATLQYDKANALLVVMSCWTWLQLRATRFKTSANRES